MRVLHINCNYMTTVLHQTMVEHLNKTGVESRVFAPVYDASLAVIRPKDYVTVSECFNKWDRIHFGYKQRKIRSAMENTFDVKSFDTLHAYTLFTDGNCAMKLSQKYGVPYVVAVRSTDVNAFFKYRPWLRARGVEIMENASAVFFLSQRYMDLTLNKYVPGHKREALRQKCSVVPNGIDDFWLKNPPAPRSSDRLDARKDKRINLIVAGRINRNKNQITAMKATQKLCELGYDARLCVVGNAENEAVLSELKECPLVTCHPAQPKEKLIGLYRENDIFVLPSYEETFGLVYAEAMSQGLPVVYTRGQGFDGQFPEGIVGFSTDPDSPAEIAEKVIAIVNNYEQISSRVPEQAKQFNWDDIAAGYSRVYQQITFQN